MEQLQSGDDYKSHLQYSTNGGTTWLDVPSNWKSKITLPTKDGSVLCKVTVKRWCNNWKWWNSNINSNNNRCTITTQTQQQEQEQSQMMRTWCSNRWRCKSKYWSTDAGSVKSRWSNINIFSKTIKRSWIGCKSRFNNRVEQLQRWWIILIHYNTQQMVEQLC